MLPTNFHATHAPPMRRMSLPPSWPSRIDSSCTRERRIFRQSHGLNNCCELRTGTHLSERSIGEHDDFRRLLRGDLRVARDNGAGHARSGRRAQRRELEGRRRRGEQQTDERSQLHLPTKRHSRRRYESRGRGQIYATFTCIFSSQICAVPSPCSLPCCRSSPASTPAARPRSRRSRARS